MTRALPVALAVAVTLGFGACGGDEIPGADRGEELFRSASLSVSDLNVFACATCHEVVAGERPTGGPAGYHLEGVANRARFWGGDYASLRDAVSACLLYFMKSEVVDPQSDDLHALYEYLIELSPEGAPAEALPFTVVETVVNVPRGDAGRGAAVFERACLHCHGEAFTADGSILRETVNLPGVTTSYPVEFPDVDPSLVVIEKVRHGRFFAIGGDMPPFSREAITDEELGDLLAYLEL